MKRRTLITASIAALTAGLARPQEAKKKATTRKRAKDVIPPDTKKEAHQIALMLLLIDPTNRTYFFNNATYTAGTDFNTNGIDATVYNLAHSPYDGGTAKGRQNQCDLKNALSALRTQVILMGQSVQGSTQIYLPGDPCPYKDGNGNMPTVEKLTV